MKPTVVFLLAVIQMFGSNGGDVVQTDSMQHLY